MQQPESSPGIVSKTDMLPICYIAYTRDVLQEQGIELTPHLESVGLPADLLDSKVTEVSQQHYYQLISQILESVDISALGLRVGQKFSLVDYGILGYAILSCPTLGRALQTFLRYQEIVGSNASFTEELRIENDEACLTVQCQKAQASVLRFEVEESFGQWTAPGSITTWSDNFHLNRVDFTFADPGYSELYQTLFQCPVYFNQPENKLHFSAKLLDHPLSMANEATSQICQQQCETILENLKQQGGLVEQVRRIIINQPGQPPSPEEIAGLLNMSYRTLRRRLKEEGTSVTEILYDVRMSLAQEYLCKTELSIQEIAFLLGYNEVNNFYRAFKKWNGQTAADYRAQHRQQSA